MDKSKLSLVILFTLFLVIMNLLFAVQIENLESEVRRLEQQNGYIRNNLLELEVELINIKNDLERLSKNLQYLEKNLQYLEMDFTAMADDVLMLVFEEWE